MSWEDLILSRVIAPRTSSYPSYVRWDIDGIAFRHEYSEQLHLLRTLCFRRATTHVGGLLDLVGGYGSSTQCSNPLDKVYAFLAMAQDSPDLPAIVPDYGASAAEILLQVWLRSILQRTKAVRPLSPGPFMDMLGFRYANDCQFADFLLDVFETQYVRILTDSTSRKAFSRFYNAFIDAVQAIFDSGKQSQAQRLGKILPPKIEWFRTRWKNASGHSMTFSQRKQETSRRFAIDKQFLWNCREELRQAGRWACTKNLRDLVNPSQFRLPLTLTTAPTTVDPAFRGSWLVGTQPGQIFDEDNRPYYYVSRRWYRGKRRGLWVRPSAVDTK